MSMMGKTSSPEKRAKRALITGVTGQDGSYLARFLLDKGYEVHGIVRRASLFNTDRIDDLYHDPHVGGMKLTLHYGDLADGSALRHVLEKVAPDEVYNLGAQSHVKVSFDLPEYTADVDALGTLRLLEALRDHVRNRGEQVRLLSSRFLGNVRRVSATTERAHPVLSAQSLCGQQAGRPLVCRQLSGGLWSLYLQRNPVQS